MKKEGKNAVTKKKVLKDIYKNKTLWIIIGIIIVVAVVVGYFISGNNQAGENEENSISETPEVESVTPLELVLNKETYEGKTIRLTNAHIPTVAFIYVQEDGLNERLFIRPIQSEYGCFYFNLLGKLEKDTETSREWVFLVDEFDCLQKN